MKIDERIIAFFDSLVARIMSGDLEWLDDVYVYPLSLFVNDTIRIERSSEDTYNYLTARRKDLIRFNVSHMTAKVLEVTHTPSGRRFTAMVEYIFWTSDGSERGRNLTRYYCQDCADGTIRVESIDVKSLGLPSKEAIPPIRRH